MAVLAGPLPAWAGAALLVGIAIHLALEKLVCGRWLRALGCHREAARTAGVPVAAVTVGAYGLSGFCAGLAAVFLATPPPGGGGPPSAWWLVDILGAVVIGGVRLSGGRGSVGFVFLGALTMVALGTVLTLAGAPQGLVAAVKTLLVLAVLAARPERAGGTDPG
jgi:ribose transport system permease protein